MPNNRLHYAKDDPAAIAWDLLRDLKIQDFPIDPRRIATKLGIVVWERELPVSCDGCLMRVGNAWGILVNARIRSKTRRNFTIAHEIGHYLLERDTVHTSPLHQRFNAVMTDQNSRNKKGQTYLHSEQRANQFAVELLMPTPIFSVDSSSHTQVGLPAIAELAAQYGTSLTSTAIHYTRLSKLICAIVFSEEGIIRYFAYSEGFRKNKNCYLVNGQTLHPKALASRFANISYPTEFKDEVPLNYWCRPDQRKREKHSAESVDHKIIEHSRRIPSTKQIMSFLRIPSLSI
ncbi:ImmA/IrrE family metallo-endopeptidase [Candidatus Poribacteria bacterium]|nr:ImmA/IrrE family metallo-endopeptidase [Candidatus Poribacteria bacterium]MYI93283.1 ImmA/IrrE family metallo-endopeptidase [Candidatus Poribacteria bacterium]